MSFSVALSGLNAAAKDLAVTGNNIANTNTTGFKESRTEFVDVYAASINGVGKTQVGSGVRVANVAQQFTQGNLADTGNNLDLAISGEGFFSLASDLNTAKPSVFSRSGEFKLDKEGFVVSNQGNFLMSFKPNGTTISEGFSEGVYQPLKINATQGTPMATTSIAASANLNASKVVPLNFPSTGVSPVDPSDPKSYNHTSSLTIYDSQGNSHIASMYFVTDKQSGGAGTANQWQSYFFIDGIPFNVDGTKSTTPATHIPTTLNFSDAGQLTTTPAKIDFVNIASSDIDPGLSVGDFNFSYDFGNSTQYGAEFSINDLAQNGLASGNLTGMQIDKEGVVSASFSNGGSDILGKIALTRFPNPQGLSKIGDSSWRQSTDSGEAVSGQAGTGSFGVINSGSLESSNVDVSEQLVQLIIAQQAYQANAQSITTEKTIMQAILNA